MNNQQDAMFDENESPQIHQRNEPRDIKDLIGHTFSTIPPEFKPALTIPGTARPDQGVSDLPEDLTIIERITTSHRVEEYTVGTNGLVLTFIDGTKYIPSSTESETKTLNQQWAVQSRRGPAAVPVAGFGLESLSMLTLYRGSGLDGDN
ncbi:hypothetical protein IL306_012730 [Fusarium sp. DS 682]|nr:hypothetical protein IL306_012730 [Fusarium sp. DS 682]